MIAVVFLEIAMVQLSINLHKDARVTARVVSIIIIMIQFHGRRGRRLREEGVWVGLRDAHRQKKSNKKSGSARMLELGHDLGALVGDEVGASID